MKDRLADAIARLPERESLSCSYYYENLTLREIGEVLGVTESRVSQLHTKAVLRLKSRLQGDPLAEGECARPRSLPCHAAPPLTDRDEAEVRASQQAAVAALGQGALAGTPLERLLDEAANGRRARARHDFASVLELTGDGHGLLIRAGALASRRGGAPPIKEPGFALKRTGRW